MKDSDIDILDPLDRATVIVINGKKVHESVMRTWRVMIYVEWMLEQNAPPSVVLAYIDSMRRADSKEEVIE